MPEETRMVAPSARAANGLRPLFSSKKRYDITCGKCGFGYRDRVFCVTDEARSRCPMCNTINRWLHSEWFRFYQNACEQQEREEQQWLGKNILNALSRGTMRARKLTDLLNAHSEHSFSVGEVRTVLASLMRQGSIKKRMIWWYKKTE